MASKKTRKTTDAAKPVRVAVEQLVMVPVDALVPYANNARTHSQAQIAQLRGSLREFGFVTPVLIDAERNIIAGHGRVEAARLEGMTEVPCVLVEGLTETQRKAYILADNRLSELSGWDRETLELEMQELSALKFDMALTGFYMAPPQPLVFQPDADGGPDKLVSVQSYNLAAPGQGTGSGPAEGVEPKETEEYRQFVDKFKPKKTTDDCYTPETVYNAVRDWAVPEYNLEGAEIIRPFYPGGDYRSVEYPSGCVVIDNPPFSILSEICTFYLERKIHFFLFAPGVTLFSTASGRCNYLPIGVSVTYANGACVNTSFVTDLGDYKVSIEPNLYRAVADAEAANHAEAKRDLPGYVYPDSVLSVAINKLAKRGVPLRVKADEALFVRALDAQKEVGAAIYGGGFLVSDCAAAERAAAERAAAERAAATQWKLSAREIELMRALGKGGREDGGDETADGPGGDEWPEAPR